MTAGQAGHASPALHERLAGAVWGQLVGDAVGVPYEFRPAERVGGIRFGASGSHGQPPGTWSDDGALMLALLDSLLATGFDTTDQARRALAWYREKAYTPDGDGRFDVGGATAAAIQAFESGTAAEDAGPTHDRANGNGSLMRILPLALVERDVTDAELVGLAHRASRVTHGTVRAQVACALYSLVVRRLLGRAGDRAEALDDARRSLRSVYEAQDASGDHVAALDHLEAYPERGGRGRVWDSYWSAWDAFAGADDYASTIRRAVAYGNDTDTTAAIAGGLAGAWWGIGGIPGEWLRGMRGRDIAEPLVTALTRPLDPIRVDPVDLRTVPGLATATGRLGMTFAPGKRDHGRAAIHRRDLDADVRWLRDAYAVDTFVLLLEDHELDLLGVQRLPERLAEAGIELIRFPIVDRDVPADREAFRGLVHGLRERIATGRHVVVACRGGLGRTGTVVGCLLRDGGLDGDEAIEQTRAARHGAIEMPAQERFVIEWPGSISGARA